MTHREKAEQLVNMHFESDYDLLSCYFNKSLQYEIARQSALVTVDIILKMINENDIDVWDINILKYWEEIKLEIPLL